MKAPKTLTAAALCLALTACGGGSSSNNDADGSADSGGSSIADDNTVTPSGTGNSEPVYPRATAPTREEWASMYIVAEAWIKLNATVPSSFRRYTTIQVGWFGLLNPPRPREGAMVFRFSADNSYGRRFLYQAVCPVHFYHYEDGSAGWGNESINTRNHLCYIESL